MQILPLATAITSPHSSLQKTWSNHHCPERNNRYLQFHVTADSLKPHLLPQTEPNGGSCTLGTFSVQQTQWFRSFSCDVPRKQDLLLQTSGFLMLHSRTIFVEFKMMQQKLVFHHILT